MLQIRRDRGYRAYEKCEHGEKKNKRFDLFEISTATIHCLSIHIDKNEEICYTQNEIRKEVCAFLVGRDVLCACTSV